MMIKLTGLTKRYPGHAVTANAVDGLDLEVPEGKLVALLGPSGCGKTTTLRMIAGLERNDGGCVEIDGKVVSDPGRGVFVGPDKRPIGIVFQSYAIWPHMTVAQNVMFPLRVGKSKVPRAAAHERALEALDMVGLADLASRPAPNLSGGQQQRVALARALVREPRVLLLDEPLSNLDKGLRDRMRDQIRSVQQLLGITTVFVTHDQDEALAISDDVVVMDGGAIVERGLPQEIYSFPRNEFTARFLGVGNSLDGVVDAVAPDSVTVRVGDFMVTSANAHGVAKDDEVSVFLRPESFRLSRKEGPWEGTIEFSIYHGDCWDYHVRVAEQLLRVRVYQEKVGIAHGDRVFLSPDPEAAIVLPRQPAAPGSAAAASPSLPITA
jgi:iron(III) transport system ATP-binding protein